MRSYSGGVRHDYKVDAYESRPPRWRALSLFAGGAAVPILGVAFVLTGEHPGSDSTSLAFDQIAMISPAQAKPAPELTDPVAEAASITTAEPVAEVIPEAQPSVTASQQPETATADYDMLELIVRRNDTLDALFRRNSLSIADLAAMLDIPVAAEPLRKLMPGDRLTVAHRGADVLSLERELRDDAILSIRREADGFSATEIPREIEIRVVGRHGVVRSSLFGAGMAAEIPDAVIMAMAGIFQWDIDFLLDVRVDDQFTLLYEERWREGEMIGTRNILAAEYVNRGKAYRVVRFEDSEGKADHFTEDGRSVRKAFVRAPVEFTRISGSFDPNRRHPILNTIRAHRGVDYAAPTGTPVIAAGDGRIIQRGSNGGFGNSVTIQHGGNITTLYAHLSRFAAPRRGDRVRQGQVIGYVGQTGLATGPHLHYEYRLNGVHRNPRTVELPPADPVPQADKEKFAQTSVALWRQLDAFRSAWVAAAN